MVVRVRRDRKTPTGDVAPMGPADNGSNGSAAVDAPSPRLNGSSGLQLQKVLLQRHLVTEAQIEQALATDAAPGADVGEVLVNMRILDEHDLISARAELYGMDVADLRQTDPEQQALDLIPDSMAREFFVIPVALDEVGLHVAMADQPSPEFISLLGETSGTAIRPMLAPLSGNSTCGREQLPGHRKARPPRRGIRGRRGLPKTEFRHHDSDAGCGGGRCTGRPGRRSHPDAGHA